MLQPQPYLEFKFSDKLIILLYSTETTCKPCFRLGRDKIWEEGIERGGRDGGEGEQPLVVNGLAS